jgi:hypothetical protein
VRGSLEYWIRRYGVVRYLVVLVALLAGGVIAVAVFHPAKSSQVTMAMKPAAPLTTAACVSQARHYGYAAAPAGALCATGRGLSWYHARLTNKGGYDFTRCRATGYDAGGRVVFRGLVPFDFAGPRGLFAPGHRSIEFSWYLPRQAGSPAARYVTDCTARQYPWS